MKSRQLFSMLAVVGAMNISLLPDAGAQGWAFGIRGGAAIARLDADTWESRTGYSVSAVVIAPLIEMVSFQFEPGVTVKGASGSRGNLLRSFGREVSLTYLQFPLLFRSNLAFSLPGPIRPVAYVGPAVSLLVSCRYVQDIDDPFSGAPAGTVVACADRAPGPVGIGVPFVNTETVDLGILAGLGLEIDISRKLRTTVDARFEHGAYSVDILDGDQRNQTWTFSVTFLYAPGD